MAGAAILPHLVESALTGTEGTGPGRKRGHVRGRALRIIAGLAFCAAALPGAVAPAANDRTISFYNMHTKETLTVTYMRNGRHVPAAMKKINHMLRDWRRDEATDMDPELIDLVYEIHQELGSKKPVHVVSGYRSPTTNANLRKRSSGVAKHSQHVLGKAIDLYFPDVPLEKLREVGLRHQDGGVGYYPTSGRPFVHIDTGSVRHWPRMPRQQLARLFPDGNTLHIPADGKPLARAVKTEDVRVASIGPEKTKPDKPTSTGRPMVLASATTGVGADDPSRAVMNPGKLDLPSLSLRSLIGLDDDEAEEAPAAVSDDKQIALAALDTNNVDDDFVPPLPSKRPARGMEQLVAAYATASLGAPRGIDKESRDALAALSAVAAARIAPSVAPGPADNGNLMSGGMSFQVASLGPFVATQRVEGARFAVLSAPEQRDLGGLVYAPRRTIDVQFSTGPQTGSEARTFSGPAVSALRVVSLHTPLRTAAVTTPR